LLFDDNADDPNDPLLEDESTLPLFPDFDTSLDDGWVGASVTVVFLSEDDIDVSPFVLTRFTFLDGSWCH
jgi:hypothetical protein